MQVVQDATHFRFVREQPGHDLQIKMDKQDVG